MTHSIMALYVMRLSVMTLIITLRKITPSIMVQRVKTLSIMAFSTTT